MRLLFWFAGGQSISRQTLILLQGKMTLATLRALCSRVKILCFGDKWH